MLNLLPVEKAELLHSSCSFTPRNDFEKLNLCLFWVKNKIEFPLLSRNAILLLLHLTTTYLWELGFFKLTQFKTKARNRFNTPPDIRVVLSSCVFNWNQLLMK